MADSNEKAVSSIDRIFPSEATGDKPGFDIIIVGAGAASAVLAGHVSQWLRG